MIALSHARSDEPDLAAENPADEATLVRDTLGSNPRAFEEIVRLHTRRVFNFLYHLTRNRHDAEDLTQQTFIKAFHSLPRFDLTRPLINWLLTIARRSALNHFRAAKKWEVMPETMAASGPSPAHSTEERDETDSLWERARRLLSQREFEVMWLRFAEELSTEDAARVAGLTETHVKVLVFRARQKLLKGEKSP
jgi:RNA polymerase sigma-70 factor (ECF subfamily)